MKLHQPVRECSACGQLVVLEAQREFASEEAMRAYVEARLDAHVCGPRVGSAAAVKRSAS
jgi:hypothetical protein